MKTNIHSFKEEIIMKRNEDILVNCTGIWSVD